MPPKSLVLCKYYSGSANSYGCTAGSSCRFSHDLSSSQSPSSRPPQSTAPPASIKTMCKYVERGGLQACKVGLACAFLHSSYEADEALRRRLWEQRRAKGGDAAAKTATATATTTTNSKAGSKGTGAASTTPTEASEQLSPPPPPPPSSDAGADVEVQWSLPGDGSDDSAGVVFYGAPGLKPSSSTTKPVSGPPNWRKLLAGDGESPKPTESGVSAASESTPSNDTVVVCLDSSISVPPASASPLSFPECQICLSDIVSPPYGLLSCVHSFHLSCLRSWRSSSSAPSALTSVRSCPSCRVSSPFVVPSCTLPASVEEVSLIRSKYKEDKGVRRCRNYDAEQTCQFGSSCLFRHVDSTTGEDVRKMQKPRYMVDEEGNARGVTRQTVMDFIKAD